MFVSELEYVDKGLGVVRSVVGYIGWVVGHVVGGPIWSGRGVCGSVEKAMGEGSETTVLIDGKWE